MTFNPVRWEFDSLQTVPIQPRSQMGISVKNIVIGVLACILTFFMPVLVIDERTKGI